MVVHLIRLQRRIKKIMTYLIDKYKPEKFVFLPVGNNYNKPELIPFSKRVDMLKLIAKGHKQVVISTIEDEPTYKGTLDALERIKQTYQKEVAFVIGGDNILTLDQWINADILIKKHKIIVIDRGGIDIQALINQKFPKDKGQFDNINLSLREASRLVRSDFNQYEDYVSESVSQYIRKKSFIWGVIMYYKGFLKGSNFHT